MNRIGVLIRFAPDRQMEEEFRRARDMGFNCCQLCCWEPWIYTEENAKMLRRISDETGVVITALWAGWSGPKEWNFRYGPATLGLVPPAYRDSRLAELEKGSRFAQWMGVSDVITHVGFLPENPDIPDFIGTVAALRTLCKTMKSRGQYFLFETGQETPVTMLRTIEAIGLDNLGINFDTANLLLYGKANSADALDVFGKYVRNTHCKDGEYPTEGNNLGLQKPLGEGRADLPLIFRKLKALGYEGPYIIEREISGEKQIADIKEAKIYIGKILKEIEKRDNQ